MAVLRPAQGFRLAGRIEEGLCPVGPLQAPQRRLEIGYGRAARIIDQMAEEGIVGPYQGSQAREVLWTLEQFETWRKQQAGAAT